MTANRSDSIKDYRLLCTFETLRKRLLTGPFSDRLEQPLAHWVEPNDRRLPVAFLGRTVGDLLATPFQELTATRGIGEKKIHSLVELLQRATKEMSTAARSVPLSKVTAPKETANGQSFEPQKVSEIVWEQWRLTIREHGLGYYRLGHLAPTLKRLPTVIWYTPLHDYLDITLRQMRCLRMHGEKRVNAVLEVFHSTYLMLTKSHLSPGMGIRPTPRFVPPVEAWLLDVKNTGQLTTDKVMRHLAIPMVSQLNLDCNETTVALARGRIGINGREFSVKELAERHQLTRARIYQLLEDCSRAMRVRWPEGDAKITELLNSTLEHETHSSPGVTPMIQAIMDVFYSQKSAEFSSIR